MMKCSRILYFVKKLLTFLPIIVGIVVGMVGDDINIIRLSLWLIFGAAIIGLAVDFAFCKYVRWRHGLPAFFPKPIPTSFFVQFGILIVVFYALTEGEKSQARLEAVAQLFRFFQGSILTLGMSLACMMSFVLGGKEKNFVAIEALEGFNQKELDEFEESRVKRMYLYEILDTVGKLWGGVIGLLFLIGVALGIWGWDASQDKDRRGEEQAAGTTSAVLPPVIVVLTASVVQPMLIRRKTRQITERLQADGTFDREFGSGAAGTNQADAAPHDGETPGVPQETAPADGGDTPTTATV